MDSANKLLRFPTLKPVEAKEKRSLEEVVEDVAELLPQQSPLHMFVHHNTLHAFEHLHFEQAALRAAERFGTEPYQSEEQFAQSLKTARIRSADIEAVLGPPDPDADTPIVPGGPSRRELRNIRLHNLFEIPKGPALRWMLEETRTLFRFHSDVAEFARAAILQSSERMSADAAPMTSTDREEQALEYLWKQLLSVAPVISRERQGIRRRDQILEAFGVDMDELVHPLLIRFCAAFVDQGLAYWRMPMREQGLLGAFRSLYGLGSGPMDPWMKGLSAELRRQRDLEWSAEATVRWALEALEVPESHWKAYIEATLLSLPGWAGMIRQLEERPDTAPVDPPPSRLMDYLALQLTLDLQAARCALRKHGGGSPSDIPWKLARVTKRPELDLELVYEAFIVAQLAGLGPAEITTTKEAKRWIGEVRAFDSNERRRLLHLAYERRHRNAVLDGILGHCRLIRPAASKASFQAVFCIDDREESLRRHLEEVRPDAETYGYAGFFGVAIAYQGLEDIRPRPLCPVAVTPSHYVAERALDESEAAAFASKRRRQGRVTHSVGLGSRMLTRGGVLSALLGFLAVIPLVGRSLFPRRTERLAHWARHRAAPAPATRLHLERTEGQEKREDGLLPGYSLDEMVAVVSNVLSTMGLDENLCPVVLVVGHGSSSLNNPHEAAYNCGATGGGHGGPNARALAQMANDPRVRAKLHDQGLGIPEDTWFLGAEHNTCDDSMAYYDEDLVPMHLITKVEDAKEAMTRACELDAHERCRRFMSAPLKLSPTEALVHGEARTYDLAQPRPELGHATNAVCIVGRRERTRGLFLDRRAFLVSYEPDRDPDGDVLAGLLRAVGPVGAGINLEYYFSYIDPERYGAGSKLPHNIVGLIGVMNGHASDLRTGLPWQMVEVHEPVRLLTIVEAKPSMLEQILFREQGLARLVKNEWIQLVAWDPDLAALAVYENGRFHPYEPENPTIAVMERSADFYSGKRGNLGSAHLTAGLAEEVSA